MGGLGGECAFHNRREEARRLTFGLSRGPKQFPIEERHDGILMRMQLTSVKLLSAVTQVRRNGQYHNFVFYHMHLRLKVCNFEDHLIEISSIELRPEILYF